MLVIVFQILNPTFLSTGNIASMLVAAAILVILAVGQTFVVATGGIDLSVASIMTFGAVVFGALLARRPAGVSCLLAVAAGTAVGLVNGLLIAQGRITDFIVTLGMLSAASGAALVLADGKPVTIIDTFLLKLSTGGIGIFGWTVLIAAVVAADRPRRALPHPLRHPRAGHRRLGRGRHRHRHQHRPDQDRRLHHLRPARRARRHPAHRPGRRGRTRLEHVVPAQLGGRGRARRRQPARRARHHHRPGIGALLLTALTNGLTLLGVSQFYQPLAVGVVVVLAALLTRFQR